MYEDYKSKTNLVKKIHNLNWSLCLGISSATRKHIGLD